MWPLPLSLRICRTPFDTPALEMQLILLLKIKLKLFLWLKINPEIASKVLMCVWFSVGSGAGATGKGKVGSVCSVNGFPTVQLFEMCVRQIDFRTRRICGRTSWFRTCWNLNWIIEDIIIEYYGIIIMALWRYNYSNILKGLKWNSCIVIIFLKGVCLVVDGVSLKLEIK